MAASVVKVPVILIAIAMMAEKIMHQYGAPNRFWRVMKAGNICFSASAKPLLGVMNDEAIQMPPMDINVPAAITAPPTGPQICANASWTGTVLSARAGPITPMQMASKRK